MDPSKGNEYAPAPPGSAHPAVTGFPVNPASQMPESQVPVVWSTGLCDCTEDCGNCCMTCWCPCVTFGQIADIVDRGSPSCGASGALYTLIAVLTGCQCIYSCFYRSKLRAQYGLPESACPDFLVHCCCESCALCQSYRELKNRGFEMSLGWHGNMERRGQGYGPVAQPPPVQGGMTR